MRTIRPSVPSLRVNSASSAAAPTPIGTAAAYGLFTSKHRFSQVFYVLLITPIMIPVILIAIAITVTGLVSLLSLRSEGRGLSNA